MPPMTLQRVTVYRVSRAAWQDERYFATLAEAVAFAHQHMARVEPVGMYHDGDGRYYFIGPPMPIQCP